MAISAHANKLAVRQFHFIFTPESFYIDTASTEFELQDELKNSFISNRYKTLYEIGFKDIDENWSPTLRFLHSVSTAFINALMQSPDLEIARENLNLKLPKDAVDALVRAVPYAIGAEYIQREWIELLISKLNAEYCNQIKEEKGSVADYLKAKRENLRVPERIFFHLVENKTDADRPFAFLATYSTCDQTGKIRHEPLKYALTEYKNDPEKLLNLLSCLNKAAECAPFVCELIESGEMFHPLWFTPQDAYTLLKCAKSLESVGIICRIPNWWRKKTSRLSLRLDMGKNKPSKIGFDALVNCVPSFVVDGDTLTEKEIRAIMSRSEGLELIKGKWIEVDHEKLQSLLDSYEKSGGEMTLMNAIQTNGTFLNENNEGIEFGNGKWLNELMEKLSHPETIKPLQIPSSVHAELRPYQKVGYRWIHQMSNYGFGACLADDMGLGKTLQILTFLEKLRSSHKNARVLLIVPKSLLGNWESEIRKFTPKMPYRVLHGQKQAQMLEYIKQNDIFLTITTYNISAKLEELKNIQWTVLILDEAQAIKNPGTAQTRAIKAIPAQQRIAMTGTPVENDLSNLWSIFDFLNKGLLGTPTQFSKFQTRLRQNPSYYEKLRSMLSPFILRRLKTDKSIISDLPDKLEQIDYVNMSKKQIVLYKQEVNKIRETLELSQSAIARKGFILAEISKLKQICNHPDQYLGQLSFDPDESGKFEILDNICETILNKRERLIVFTQYREITEALAGYLEGIFDMPGFVLHGGTSAKKRTQMVDAFNGENYIPFMVISLKAGGTGLNLTAANHVIHFDRWWNPAIENQATDRAYRIGQTKKVIVHKLICRNTIEDKIDAIINDKKALAEKIIGQNGESWITELDNAQLLKLMDLEDSYGTVL